MSKFEEICAAFDESQRKFIDYRSECHDFGRKLSRQYIQFLEVPKEHFEWFNPDADKPPKGKVTIPGAMYLDDDTYWHLGLKITVIDKQKSGFRPKILIIFKFKKLDNSTFEVLIDGDEKSHKIELDKDDAFNLLFSHLQTILLGLYQNDLEDFLASQQSPRSIGFI